MDRGLLIVTGKGGVGRSAVAAAIAIYEARRGRRVLAIGMTDALGLAAHLRVASLTYQQREVRPGLHALAIEPAAGLDEYLRIQLRIKRLGPMSRAFRMLADTVPRVRDTVVIGKVIYEAASGEWDLVVADAPPTGQIVSYLRAPDTIAGLVPTGRVREQAAWMGGQLADPARTGLVMVTRAEELPVTETIVACEVIRTEGLGHIAIVVANRLLDLPDFTVDDLAMAEGAHRDAGALHLGLVDAQQRWLTRLPDARTLPYLYGLLTPGEVATRIADLWITP